MSAQDTYNSTLQQDREQLGGGGVLFTDTTAPLGASVTFTGEARRTQYGSSLLNRVVANAFSDVGGGTLRVQMSLDGVTWRLRASTSVSAGAMGTLDVTVTAPYTRVTYSNGTTAQTVFELTSALLPA